MIDDKRDRIEDRVRYLLQIYQLGREIIHRSMIVLAISGGVFFIIRIHRRKESNSTFVLPPTTNSIHIKH